jgi:hypothetical protein
MIQVKFNKTLMNQNIMWLEGLLFNSLCWVNQYVDYCITVLVTLQPPKSAATAPRHGGSVGRLLHQLLQGGVRIGRGGRGTCSTARYIVSSPAGSRPSPTR